MKGFTAIALFATVALAGCYLVQADSIADQVSDIERSMNKGIESGVKEAMSPLSNLPNMPDMLNLHMPNMPKIPGMPDMPNMPNMPNMPKILGGLRSELESMEQEMTKNLPNMPSASGMVDRIRAMIKSLMPFTVPML